jgi:hypothetical protein
MVESVQYYRRGGIEEMALLRYTWADFEDPLEAGALSTVGSKAPVAVSFE